MNWSCSLVNYECVSYEYKDKYRQSSWLYRYLTLIRNTTCFYANCLTYNSTLLTGNQNMNPKATK